MKSKTNSDVEKPFYRKRWFFILSLIFFPPLGIFLFWRYSSRNKILKVLMTLIFAFYFLFYCAWISVISEGDVQQTSSPQVSSSAASSSMPAVSSSSASALPSSKAESSSSASAVSSSSAPVQSSSSAASSKAEPYSSAPAISSSAPAQSSSTSASSKSESSSSAPASSRSVNISSEDAKQDNITYVWITATGKKYHASPSCGNIKNARETTLQEAQSMGLTPCFKCY